MVEAFRCLREEDKSNFELAVMYKEEGNEWMKKKVKKDLKEAIVRYTHALSFLDAADKEDDTKEDEPQVVELVDNEDGSKKEEVTLKDVEVNDEVKSNVEDKNILRSQILNNRALAAMHLKNYGTALGDINMV